MPSGSSITMLLMLALLQSIELPAQWRSPRLTRLGPEEGISSTINAMAQDSLGFMYFATIDGLYKYDGHTFRFFGHDPMDDNSIGEGDVNAIHAARDGKVWMTLRFGGLNSYDPHTDLFQRYPVPTLSFRSNPGAHGLYEDQNKILWVGADHFRLLSFDRSTTQFTSYTPSWIDAEKHGGRLMIMSIVGDKHNASLLWLSVLGYGHQDAPHPSYGLVSFNTSTKVFTSYPCFGTTKFQDSDGKLWGSVWDNFISRFDPQSMQCDTFQHEVWFKEQRIKHLSHDIEAYKGDLYAAFSKALLKFKTSGDFVHVLSPDKEEISFISLFTDHDDNLWIGSTQGAYVLNPDHQHIRFFSLQQFGILNRLFPGRLAYSASNNTIYLSHTNNPNGRGFYAIPLGADASLTPTFIPSGFDITGIASDYRDRIWMVGGGAFHLLDPHSNTLKRQALSPTEGPIPDVQNLKSNQEGWIAGINNGIFFWFHADAQKVSMLKIDDLPGSSYAQSFGNGFDGFSFGSKNKVYLFSNEVHVIDLATGKKIHLKYDPTFNPNLQRIQYVGEDLKGNIWMSTFTLVGQYRLEKDSLILINSYTLKDGMSSPMSHELHIDQQDRVWCFTSLGINCIDPTSGEIRYYGTKEGLPLQFIDPRQVISTTDGRIATVCDNGLIVFDPDSLWRAGEPSAQRIVISKIRMIGQPAMGDQAHFNHSSVTLLPSNKGIDIAFQALAFPTDYRIEYSYRITGLQEEWISLGQNKLVTIPSLAPGAYTFEVKVGHPQSQSPVTSLDIFVGTPLYQQPWFLILSILMLGAAIYALLRWRIRHIRAEETERSEVNKKFAELELKALRSQMNPHFMFNSLNSIKNYILHAEPKLAAEYLSNFAHLIRLILQNSREKMITLQEELETLTLYIELEQIRFDNRFEFNCIVEADVSLEQVMIPPMLLQPFIENAIWHGLMHKKEKGHLSLRFSKEEKMIACVIEDDGVGRAIAAEMKSLSANKYKSMGMGITRDRMEIMNKMDALGISAEIIDKQDAAGLPSGTIVIVRIPGAATE